MQKHGRTACGIECGGDFGGDVCTFSDTRHHDFPGRLREQIHRLVEVTPHLLSRLAQRLGGQRQCVFAGKHTLTLAAQALSQAAEQMGSDFDKAVNLLAQSAGKVVVTGVGKSAHIAAKIAATLNSTGSSAMFLHAETWQNCLWN